MKMDLDKNANKMYMMEINISQILDSSYTRFPERSKFQPIKVSGISLHYLKKFNITDQEVLNCRKLKFLD